MWEYLKNVSDASLLKAIHRWRNGLTWYKEQAATGKWPHEWRNSIAALEDALKIAMALCARRGLIVPEETQ